MEKEGKKKKAAPLKPILYNPLAPFKQEPNPKLGFCMHRNPKQGHHFEAHPKGLKNQKKKGKA